MHLCITPPNYQPIKAECLLLSHYMEIRSRSESVSKERGREGERGGKKGRGRAREMKRWREEREETEPKAMDNVSKEERRDIAGMFLN